MYPNMLKMYPNMLYVQCHYICTYCWESGKRVLITVELIIAEHVCLRRGIAPQVVYGADADVAGLQVERRWFMAVWPRETLNKPKRIRIKWYGQADIVVRIGDNHKSEWSSAHWQTPFDWKCRRAVLSVFHGMTTTQTAITTGWLANRIGPKSLISGGCWAAGVERRAKGTRRGTLGTEGTVWNNGGFMQSEGEFDALEMDQSINGTDRWTGLKTEPPGNSQLSRPKRNFSSPLKQSHSCCYYVIGTLQPFEASR